MDMQSEVLAASRRIESYVRRTPIEFSPTLSAAGDCNVFLKLENQQLTGSFKLRGAMNKLLTLDEEQRRLGVVAASTGNHGAAVACGALLLGCRALIFAPNSAMKSKIGVIENLGAELRFEGQDCIEGETAARAFADAEGRAYISPYNDPMVIAGQGTVGLELEDQVPELDVVFISVGGGGLISGTGGYLRAAHRSVEVIGASPENSAVMAASLREGRILDLPSDPTLSDGTAGGVEADSITFELCQEIIDDFVLVSEEAIAEGVRTIAHKHHNMVEGAAGTAVAAFMDMARTQPSRLGGKNIVIVLCGANIDPEVLRGIL